MISTPNLEAAEADNVLAARADERLAHAYQQIARADEQLARVTEQLAKMEHDATRSGAPRRNRSRVGRAVRGLIGLLLAALIIVAALASQSPYGDAAKVVISQWTPELISTLLIRSEKSQLPAQPGPSPVQLAATETAPPQATPTAPAHAQDLAPTSAPTSPEIEQMLQTMMRVLANVEQEVQQLRAGQEQLASDNAKVVEQLRANQQQVARLVGNTSGQNPGPKASAPLPRPVAGPTPKPVAMHPAPQAQPPQSPIRLEPEARGR